MGENNPWKKLLLTLPSGLLFLIRETSFIKKRVTDVGENELPLIATPGSCFN